MTKAAPAALARRFARFACIDWSGAKGERQAGIALAACDAGGGPPLLIDPPGHRWSREAMLAWLVARADAAEDMLIGIDFSPALPFDPDGGYFPGLAGMPRDARGLWRHVDETCADDAHLAASSYVRHPALAAYFRDGAITGARFASADRNGRLRRVERAAGAGHPASCFNLMGANQVGKSSLTGMRVLHRLGGRVPIWPFDAIPATGPLIVEIYTSIAARAARVTGGSKVRDSARLDAALDALGSPPHVPMARYDDHSTDAIVTAAWLRRAAANPALWHPPALTPALAATEGWTFGVP